MRSASFACILAVTFACGGGTDANHDGIVDGVHSPDSVSQVAPSTPVGTLSGQVLGTDFTALDNVNVTVLIGGASDAEGTNVFKAVTDNAGVWSVKNVPAAAVAQVTMTKMAYATGRMQITVPGTAGNFPVNNGNGNVGAVLLTHLDGTYRFQVVTAGGKPAKQLKALLEVTPAAVRVQDFSSSYGSPIGMFVTEATSDDNGIVELKEVPGLGEMARLNGTFSVTIGAYDEDADGRPDYLGTRRDIPARDIYLDNAPTVITLATAHASTPLSVIASNVDSMINGPGDPIKSMVRMGDALYFVFDQAVIDMSISVKVTDELGTTTVASTKQLKGTNILQVTLNPAVENGREYNIALRATSADNGSTLQRAAYFFGGDPAAPKPFAIERITWKRPPSNPSGSTQLEQGDRVIISFNQPIRNTGAQPVEILIDRDLNGNGTRTDLGEKSPPGTTNPNQNGFATVPNEPIAETGSTFANLASGYTTRFEFTYLGLGYTPVSTNTAFIAIFSKIPSSLYGFRTLWGTGVETDASGVLSPP